VNQPVFLDTVGILGLLNASDQWHGAAVSAFAVVVAENHRPITTNYVLAESANAAARSPLRKQICVLREEMEARGRLIMTSDEDWGVAWAAYSKGEAGGAGLVDDLSFVVMRRLGINKAFTNDKHFRAAGFETLF
jgi:predicted nucleic acid-binding protein